MAERCLYAISLWQPWASFIAIGVKPFETRDWPPPAKLIGQRIAIHAAKKTVDRDDREWASRVGAVDLPLGVMVCTATLAGAYRCGQDPERPWILRITEKRSLLAPDLDTIKVDEYGDYSPGRWAWLLTQIEPCEPPISARGAQGFWKWVPIS